MKSMIEIRKISITDLRVDAVVNAANSSLAAGGGVCGAIFKAAGQRELQAACDAFGHCKTGNAVITPGFKLKAKYVIHAVGPIWRGGQHGEPELLKSAYKNSLECALANNCHSVGFPLISAGIYGYPIRGAWHEALLACSDFLDRHLDRPLQIIFAVLNDEILKIGKGELLKGSISKYKVAERSDWKTNGMPNQNDRFVLHREFNALQMEALRHGNIPQEMEDKWFWYMEGNTLYAHRSWTGNCIYIIEFSEDNDHAVTVNRDPDQYGCRDLEEDRENLNRLLNWWTQSDYDYYNEWLAETADALKKAGKTKVEPKTSPEQEQ